MWISKCVYIVPTLAGVDVEFYVGMCLSIRAEK